MQTDDFEQRLADESPDLYQPSTGNVAVFYTNSDYRDDPDDTPGVCVVNVKLQDMYDWYREGDFECAYDMLDGGPSFPRDMQESPDWSGYVLYQSEEYKRLLSSIEGGGWVRLLCSDRKDEVMASIDEMCQNEKRRSSQ